MNNPKIFVVDDEPIILTGFKKIFDGTEYEIKTFSNGYDALNALTKEMPDLVYTDMVMPDMNGAILCKKIKKMSPSTEVVLFSGSPEGMSRIWHDFVRAGGKDLILRKPLSKKEVLDATKKLFKK